MSVKLGIIADDFTGASDIASFLRNSGNKVVLYTDIPTKIEVDCDAIVVAEKIRSVDVNVAVDRVSKCLDFFENNNINRFYYKYCSTFDSTPKGNIGPILDYILERTNEKYTILCPSLPINKRKVKDGILYVDNVPLAESPLKDHPLNPMWDSYIPNLMKDQSKYPCYCLSIEDMCNEEVFNEKMDLWNSNEHYYIIPDYMSDDDSQIIYDKFENLKVLSGGSALLSNMKNKYDNHVCSNDDIKQKAIILCGSCSKMTGIQVKDFKNKKNCYYTINSMELLGGKIQPCDIFEFIKNNLPSPSLIYSDGCEIVLEKDRKDFDKISQLMEVCLSDLSLLAKENGFNKIIVAGGETSGAVVLKLGYSGFYVGDSVAPGVPVLQPIEDPNMKIILKSGNFGDEEFFTKALEK